MTSQTKIKEIEPDFGNQDPFLPEEFNEIGAPTISTEEIPCCPVCDSSSYKHYAYGYDYEMLTCSNKWLFTQCNSCSHVWLNPRPAISELGVIYPPSYYAYDFEDKVNPIALKGKALLDSAKLSSILKLSEKPIRSYMDVGCGSGRYLETMHKSGLLKENIYGIELDDKVVSRLAAKGYNAHCKRVEDCEEIEPNSLDVITMFHVIEHVDNPQAVMNQLAKWLKPGGILAIETPNISSLDSRLFKKSLWGGYHIPRHWNLFNENSLSRLAESSGLSVENLSYQTGHSFWMYSLHHYFRFNRKKSLGLWKMFDPLKGLPFLVAFTGFDKLRSKLGFKTSAMLLVAKKAD